MNLQALFPDPIVRQEMVSDVHPEQASDVWIVQTANVEVIVRASRMTADPDIDFWRGARLLFGVCPGDMATLASIHKVLRPASPIPIPKVLKIGVIGGRQVAVVEKLPGRALMTFNQLPPQALEQFGSALAILHAHTRATCGDVPGTTQYPAPDFHARLADVLSTLVHRYHAQDQAVRSLLPDMLKAVRHLPALEATSPILLDMDPTQFIAEGERITGLVDVEAYAYGPRALDLIALEYLLDAQQAAAFERGYTAIQPLPALSAVRPVYRYLNRVMSVQGRVPLDVWMHAPVRFSS